MAPTVVRVRNVRSETHDVFTLVVELPDSEYRIEPGQFNMLYVFGVGEAPISLSGDPVEEHGIMHTIRSVGSVTNALANLRPGGVLGLRGPFGRGWPLEAARGNDIVIVAGGVGLPPLRPVIRRLLRHRGEFGRVAVLYGARTPADVLFRGEHDTWRKHDIQVITTVDRGDAAWDSPVGLVTTLLPQTTFDPKRTLGLMCGPEVMMRSVVREFEKYGVAEDRLYVSLERNMQCAIGLCGHCQFGPDFVCMDGPVFRYDRIQHFFNIREA
jgi:NAD(P)H-flavin reductase